MVTGEQVKTAALAAGLTYVRHHECGGCGSWVGHSIDGENLYFEPGCDCSWSPREPIGWDSVADEINMQNDEWRDKLMDRWGMGSKEQEK